MKKICSILLAFACCLLLALPASAESGISGLESTATVTERGDCQMTLKFHLSLEETAGQLVFPLGEHVSQVTVNGAKTRLRRVDGARSAVLKSDTGFSGELDFLLTYTISGCVSPQTNWQLRLPILSGGLAYPISDLSFSVTMPGEFTQTPAFNSGYYGDDVDNYMTVTVSGPVISGKVNTPLKDHETLSMTLDTDPAMFPRNHTVGETLAIDRVGILVCFAAAVLYWILFLRWMPPRIVVQPQPPTGYTAGELGSRLTGGRVDLALAVTTWAQLGYLTIHISEDHAVTLHKLMDMGNERGAFEQHTFQAMFGKGEVVAATSSRFRGLYQQVAASGSAAKGQFTAKSGNPLWARLLAAGAGGFAGVAIGDCLAPAGASRWAALALFGAVGLGAAWLIQRGILCLVSDSRRMAGFGAAAAVLLLALGAFSGGAGYAAAAVALQCLVAVGTIFGGQRSEAGKQTVQSLLGLRRYCRTVDRKQLRRITAHNPGYYFDLAPYALAMGVDRAFARQFESMRLPQCSWLVSDFPQSTLAVRWYPLLRETVQILRGKAPKGLPQDSAPPQKPRKKKPKRTARGRSYTGARAAAKR